LFSLNELNNCTNNFSDTHEIGSGGYGKVSNKNNKQFLAFLKRTCTIFFER